MAWDVETHALPRIHDLIIQLMGYPFRKLQCLVGIWFVLDIKSYYVGCEIASLCANKTRKNKATSMCVARRNLFHISCRETGNRIWLE